MSSPPKQNVSFFLKPNCIFYQSHSVGTIDHFFSKFKNVLSRFFNFQLIFVFKVQKHSTVAICTNPRLMTTISFKVFEFPFQI